MILPVFCMIAILSACHRQDQPDLQRWQTTNSVFNIRIVERQEKRFPLSRFCYYFQSTAKDSDQWHEAMTECTDDDISIPHDQVRFINGQMAYVFMVYKYAITTDGGNSWTVWDVNDAGNKYSRQLFIKEADVSVDGSGTLILASRSDVTQTTRLHTTDFGHSWK